MEHPLRGPWGFDLANVGTAKPNPNNALVADYQKVGGGDEAEESVKLRFGQTVSKQPPAQDKRWSRTAYAEEYMASYGFMKRDFDNIAFARLLNDMQPLTGAGKSPAATATTHGFKTYSADPGELKFWTLVVRGMARYSDESDLLLPRQWWHPKVYRESEIDFTGTGKKWSETEVRFDVLEHDTLGVGEWDWADMPASDLVVPRARILTLSNQKIDGGQTLAVKADVEPAGATVAWTASAGTVAPANTANTTFTAPAAHATNETPVVLTLTVSSGNQRGVATLVIIVNSQ